MLTLMTPGIEDYALSKSEKHNNLLEQLMKETYESVEYPQMLTGPIEGQFLKMMVRVTGAKRVVEVGTFTGYASLSMAEGLPDDGKITTLDLNPICLAVARKYIEKSEHGKKIEIIEGPALDSIAKMDGPIDLVFIDADKTNYLNYYEALLPKMKTGGVILVDNVLWSGKVLDPKSDDDKAIAAFNDRVSSDERVDKVLLTVRDGVFFLRKR